MLRVQTRTRAPPLGGSEIAEANYLCCMAELATSPLFQARPVEHPAEVPFMLFADAEGEIVEHETWRCVGRTGKTSVVLQPEDFIPLPEGSEFFFLPGRVPLGWNPKSGKIEPYEGTEAVAAFISPAHSQTYLAAYEKRGTAPILPLYAYTAVGWFNDRFWTAAEIGRAHV